MVEDSEKGELVVRDPISRLAAFMNVQPAQQHSRLEEKSPHPLEYRSWFTAE